MLTTTTMRTTRWILLTARALIALPICSAPVPGSADCGLRRYASIDLSTAPGALSIPVTVENTQARMYLNTGSSLTVMWKPIATQMGLKIRPLRGGGNVHWGGTQDVTDYAVAKTITLGSLRLQGADFLLVPKPEGSLQAAETVPIVGAIGMDFFSKIDFELDFKNKKLNLYSQDHCPGSVVYWSDSAASVPIRRGQLGNEYFPLELEGKRIEATLSTGEQLTSLTTDVTQRLYGFDEHSAGIQTDLDSEGHVRAQYRAMALTGKDIRVTNTMVLLLTRLPDCRLQTSGGADNAAHYTGCLGNEAPLHVGLNILEKLHLYFATKENVLYLTAADASR